MAKDTGGQAFPRQDVSLEGCNHLHQTNVKGMTLRDYFAGQALVGIIGMSDKLPESPTTATEFMAAGAYMIADAMISERNK